MILNQCCVFHLGILWFSIFPAFSIHDFKSVLCVPSQDAMLFIFFMRFHFMILISVVCSISIFYCVYILQAFSIPDFKSVFCVPSQDTMLFTFFTRFQFMTLNQCFVFHLRILWYLYFTGVFNSCF